MCRHFDNYSFEYDDICCAVEGGQFGQYLSEQRDVASGIGVSIHYHNDRDLNDLMRFEMYFNFIRKIGVRGQRKEILICYVNAVREIWPEQRGSYAGFEFRDR